MPVINRVAGDSSFLHDDRSQSLMQQRTKIQRKKKLLNRISRKEKEIKKKKEFHGIRNMKNENQEGNKFEALISLPIIAYRNA